jgi:hypothetical protein
MPTGVLIEGPKRQLSMAFIGCTFSKRIKRWWMRYPRFYTFRCRDFVLFTDGYVIHDQEARDWYNNYVSNKDR